jgi:hypothetical protein
MAVAIALADDSVIVREGVAGVLAAQPGMQVVVSCGDLLSLLEAGTRSCACSGRKRERGPRPTPWV